MYNILVCDDDKEIVKAIDIYLSKENYKIFKAYNGNEALNIIKNNEIHLGKKLKREDKNELSYLSATNIPSASLNK